MEGLRDIKGIVTVHEYSFETLLAIIITTIIVLSILFYLYKNRRKRGKKLNKYELALKNLKNIDFDDVKKTVYTFSVDGFLHTDEKNIDEFKKIEDELLKYKYQKEVPSIDEALKIRIENFIKGLK